MPLIDFKCTACRAKVKDAMFSIDEEYEMRCPKCSVPMQRVYSSPAVFGFTFTPGYSVATDQYFSTKREKENYLRENGMEVRG